MQPKIIYNQHVSGVDYQVFSERPDLKNMKHLAQVHSDIILGAEANSRCEADGFILSQPTKAHYAIVTADCMPILAIGSTGISFVHAGWQGVAKKILRKENIKKIDAHTFFVGPHIGSCCYEVSDEFRDNFPESKCFIQRNGKLYFDLYSQIRADIVEQYPSANIINSGECTHCNEKYHSYRRDKTTKRNWNIIYF